MVNEMSQLVITRGNCLEGLGGWWKMQRRSEGAAGGRPGGGV